MLDRIARGGTDLVFELLAAGGDLDSEDQNGVSRIEWWAYYGDVSAVRFLLDKGESLDSRGENFDLQGAAFPGHWRLCEFLIERGAEVKRSSPGKGDQGRSA